jgi:hypothetical protein
MPFGIRKLLVVSISESRTSFLVVTKCFQNCFYISSLKGDEIDIQILLIEYDSSHIHFLKLHIENLCT